MPPLNVPLSGESPEVMNSDKKSGNIQELLDQSIVLELKNSSGVIDPILYNTLKYPDIYASIRNKMKSLRDMEDANFVNIKDSDIIAVPDAKIIQKIEKYARPLRDARKNLYRNLRQTFSNIGEKISGFDEAMLAQKIEYLDENEINKFYKNNRTLSEFVSTYFHIPREALLFRDHDFISVFATDNLRNSSPDLYNRVERAAMNYRNRAILPDLGLIRELIGFYGTSNKAKKKEICEFFDISIPLSRAIKSGLVSGQDVETFAKHEFSHVWDSLDDASRKSLIDDILIGDDNYNIEVATFDIDTIDQYFSSTQMKDILSRAISDKLAKKEATHTKTSGIMQNLEAEIGADGIARIHRSFLREMQSKIKIKEGIPRLANIENLEVGSVLIFQDEAEKVRYFRLEETDASIGDYDHGVIFSDITGKEAGTIGEVKSKDSVDYNTLANFLGRIESGRVLTADEFLRFKTNKKDDTEIGQDHIQGSDKILDISNTEDVLTLEGFTREINILDPDGEKIGLSAGVAFKSKGTLENGESYEGIWEIKSITPPNISIANRKYTEVTTLDAFLEVAKKQTFHRIAKLENPKDILSVLHGFGVDENADFEGENLVTKVHEHDAHGHKTEVKKNYEFFQSKAGGHIRINGFTDGLVSFGEYASPKSLADVQKVGNTGKLSDKQKKGLYINQTVSYGEFIEYLKKNDMKATTDNLLVPDASDTYHPHDPHFERDFGSFMSKVGSWWSVADMMKGFSNLTHGVEHFFEKNAKLNASRFALSMGRKLNLPLDIMAQLQADEVGNVKEIIEKIQEKFKNLNGPIARNKALHIAHNPNARPEEVGAAILFLVKSYGALYAEDIAYAQGSESFINGLLTSCGFTGQALTDMKKKAREKSKVLLGNEAGSDLTEEEIIWGFMKMMDGNSEKYPVAATLVKAMGGPGGFENAWRKDGIDGAYEKGIRQAGDLVNAEARVDNGLSALATHEFHTAIGSMEKAAEKDPSPSVQTLPVVWALGGYSKYLSTKANQKIKGYADGKGHSFHAFSFLRSKNDNDLFRYTFREALKSIDPSQVANMDKWIHDLEYDGHSKGKMEKIKPAINGLAGLWRKYHGRGLHDMLQGKNMWLVENAAKDPQIKKYFQHLGNVHQNNSGDTPHSDDNGWYIQHGYTGSPIVKSVEVDGYTVNSMERTLRKIKLDSHQLRIDKDHKERYWDPAVKMVKNLSASSQNEALKKIQFLQYRRDILLRFNEAFSSRGEKFHDFKKQEFYTDLLDMGIDVSIIFESGGNVKKKIEKTADSDYNAWKKGGYQGGSASNSEVLNIKDTVKSVISPRQDAGVQGVGRNIDTRTDRGYNVDERGTGITGQNDIGLSSGAD